MPKDRVFAKVLQEGQIQCGDEIEIMDEDSSIDDFANSANIWAN